MVGSFRILRKEERKVNFFKEKMSLLLKEEERDVRNLKLVDVYSINNS